MFLFISALLFAIAIHNLGHLLVARLLGISVSTFAIGFGPKIFGFRISRGGQKGEIEWCVNAIPFGGFMRAHGIFPDRQEYEREDLLSQGRTEEECSTLLSHDRLYCNRPGWQQAIFMSAGCIANLLGAFVTVMLAVLVLTPAPLPQHVRVETVQAELSSSSDLRELDVIQSINGEEVHTSDQVLAAFKDARGADLEMVVLRKQMTETVELKIPLAAGGTFSVGDIPAEQRRTFLGSVAASGSLFWDMCVLMVNPKRAVAEDAPPEQRAAKVESFWNDSSAMLRWTTFLVTLNLGLGLLNVLPLLPCDGAHLACALFKGMVGVEVPVSWQILISVVELVVLMLWLAAKGGGMERF